MFEALKVFALRYPMTSFLLALSVASGAGFVVTDRQELMSTFIITLVVGVIGYIFSIVVVDD